MISSILVLYRQQREEKITQLALAEATYDELLMQQVEDSSINTGEGLSRARMVKITDMEKIIDTLEAEIDWLDRKISGSGDIQNMNVRRKW